MDRRQFIEHTFILGTSTLLFPLGGCNLSKKNTNPTFKPKTISTSPDVSYVTGKDIEKTTEAAIILLASKLAEKNNIKNKTGMELFVSRADKVVIKPNIGWARTPDQAATTNPIVLKKIIELCYNAGASEVRVSDLPCNSANITFERTGIQKAVQEVDGTIFYPKAHRVKEMSLEHPIYLPLDKIEIKKWQVFIDFIEADVVINLPIAKHHSLSKLTIGMKNWYGAISGKRNQLHQAVHESIASLAYHFKPHLTIVDAIRILVRNGPTGGSINDTQTTNSIIASQNQVAADAVATTLFGLNPEDIPYIKIASEIGLGDYDLSKLNIIRKYLT